MKQEDLRYYVTVHFPRWINKSPLYFENIKHELPGFIEALETHFADEEINSFTMDWVLNMTPLNTRKKLNKIQEAKDEMEFFVWENKVIQTIREASDDEILYYALLMYLNLKDHPFAEIPKAKEPQQKHPAKWYAFYHWVLIEMGREKDFEKDRNDKCPKKEIMQFAKNRYPGISAQQFYNIYQGFDITARVANAKEYGKGYKDKLIEISNNDAEVISHLKNYPN